MAENFLLVIKYTCEHEHTHSLSPLPSARACRSICIEAYRLISHRHTRVDVQTHFESKQMQACAQTCTLAQCLFTNSSLTSMTHKQLPFSPMKGDPLPWHGTSRCITKPHLLMMASASFSYTGKHLLIFVTSASSLKVLPCHLGAQINLLLKLFA